MPDNVQPFRRYTDPTLVPVSATPSQANAASVAADFIPKGTTSFLVVNSNLCWVRLQGTGRNADGTAPASAVLAAENKGWLFPPGFTGVFTTQFPAWMSAIAVARDGYPLAGLTLVPLEVSYGGGA